MDNYTANTVPKQATLLERVAQLEHAQAMFEQRRDQHEAFVNEAIRRIEAAVGLSHLADAPQAAVPSVGYQNVAKF